MDFVQGVKEQVELEKQRQASEKAEAEFKQLSAFEEKYKKKLQYLRPIYDELKNLEDTNCDGLWKITHIFFLKYDGPKIEINFEIKGHSSVIFDSIVIDIDRRWFKDFVTIEKLSVSASVDNTTISDLVIWVRNEIMKHIAKLIVNHG